MPTTDFSIYPNALDGYEQLPLVVDLVTRVDAETVNRLRSAIANIERELGTLPSGNYTDVRTRLDALEQDIINSTGSDPGGGLEKDGTLFNVLVDDLTIKINASNELEVKTLGIITSKLADGAVTPAKASLVGTWDFASGILIADSPSDSDHVATKEYVDGVVGFGSGLIPLVAAEDLTTGDLVVINSFGEAEKANAGSGTLNDSFVIGASDGSFLTGATAQIKSSQGSLAPVRFAAAPGAGTNGMRVYLSTTSGEGTFFPDTSSGKVIYFVGIMQGADGISASPDVLFAPYYLSRRP
jgi:hypothetical protein